MKKNILQNTALKNGRSARIGVVLDLFTNLLCIATVSAFSLLVSRGAEGFIQNLPSLLLWFFICGIVYSVIYYAMGIYKIMWRFASSVDVLKYAFAIAFSVLLSFTVHFTLTSNASTPILGFDFKPFNASVYVMALATSIIVLMVFRMFQKGTGKKSPLENGENYKNVMIIGGGYTGYVIINDFRHNDEASSYRVVCAIDDDKKKHGKMIQNVPIVGGRESIAENVEKYDVSLIIFAISSCSASAKADILEICTATGKEVRTAPLLQQIVSGEARATETRKVEIEDLLGRDPIKCDLDSVLGYVENKTVLVTGGGGSIGSELCRQICTHSPKRLVIFDIYENSAYDITNELLRKYGNLDIVTRIGSVRDSSRLDSLLSEFSPDIIYHAAAHKHVPLMEDSPNEAIKNNVIGTYKLVKAADKYGVKRFVMISTDKAVNPTNIMGATKRICEMIVQTFNKRSKCEFVAVRFGNVLGSNGSVIPLFKKQISEGGPVTVTHPDIIRYFMTIPEAVSLVIQAGAYAEGGEIFVLDMGKPVKIYDLAKNLITLMGHIPGGDIKIEFTGLRPGEKLYEELLMEEEGLKATANERIFIGQPIDIDENMLFDVLDRLSAVMYDDASDVRELVKRIVPTYTYEQKN